MLEKSRMKVYCVLYPPCALFAALLALLTDATSFFSTELPRCGGETYQNHLSRCKDKSFIIPDGRRVYKDYDCQNWLRRDKHHYGKVYMANGDKWKVIKDQVGYFNPKTQHTQVLLEHDKYDHFSLLAIDEDGNIAYRNGLEYKSDGTVKTRHWFEDAINPLQGAEYKCLELPCGFSLKSGQDSKLEPPLTFYMDKYGDYRILKNVIRGERGGSVEADYLLEVYEPMESGNYLDYSRQKAWEQAFYEHIYFKANGFPEQWRDSYETWRRSSWE